MYKKWTGLVLWSLTAAVLSLGLTACGGTAQAVPTPTDPQMDAEEQSVYAALIKSMFPAELLVIKDTTSTDPGGVENTDQTLQHVLANMHGVGSQTVQTYKNRNAAAMPVRADMDLGFPYVLLSQDAMNQLFNLNQDGWQAFYEKYPQARGILTFSRVGFDTAMDQALVYVGNQGNWLAGSGVYVLLKKVNGIWTIDQKVMSWIS